MQDKKGLIRRNPESVESPWMKIREAAGKLNLSMSSLRERKAGTAGLTIVRQGDGQRRRIYFLRAEVEAHMREIESRAKRQK